MGYMDGSNIGCEGKRREWGSQTFFYLSSFEDAIALNQDGKSCWHSKFRAEILELSFEHRE